MVHPHDQSIMDVVEQGYWAAGDRSPWAYGKTLAAGDGLIWDTATATLLRLAEATGCKLHIVHTQTARQIEMIEQAKARGVDVSSETNHWTIFLATEEDIKEQGSYVLSYWVPPHHQRAVWEALETGRSTCCRPITLHIRAKRRRSAGPTPGLHTPEHPVSKNSSH